MNTAYLLNYKRTLNKFMMLNSKHFIPNIAPLQGQKEMSNMEAI